MIPWPDHLHHTSTSFTGAEPQNPRGAAAWPFFPGAWPRGEVAPAVLNTFVMEMTGKDRAQSLQQESR